ncbi:MAG: hypothetical protein KTR20_15270 [Cellvibrionaceae bacterium]|nr:hypothetical protein [Cellvibrionaceae bacterium]
MLSRRLIYTALLIGMLPGLVLIALSDSALPRCFLLQKRMGRLFPRWMTIGAQTNA